MDINVTKITNLCVDTTIGKILTIIIPSLILYYGVFKKFNFNDYNFDKMEIAVTIIFATLILGILHISSGIKKIRTQLKSHEQIITIIKNKESRTTLSDTDMLVYKKQLDDFIFQSN